MNNKQKLEIGDIVSGYVVGLTTDSRIVFTIIGSNPNSVSLLGLNRFAIKIIEDSIDQHKPHKEKLVRKVSSELESIQKRVKNLSFVKEDKD